MVFLVIAWCLVFVHGDFEREVSDLSYNRRAALEWERENRDLVTAEAAKVAAARGRVDAQFVSSSLQQNGMANSEDQGKAIGSQMDFAKARPLGNGVYEQVIDGRRIRFSADNSLQSKPVVDLCQTNPEKCRGNKGIPRYAMPQFKQAGAIDKYLATTQEMGYQVKYEKEKLGNLGAMQSQMLTSKVDGIAAAAAGDKPKRPTLEGYSPPVWGDRIADGHHSAFGLRKSFGDNAEIQIKRIVRSDNKPMTRDDYNRLWKASLATPGVTTESLADNGGRGAKVLDSSFIANGADRSRTGAAGNARREYLQGRLKQREAARKSENGFVKSGALRSREGREGNLRREDVMRRWQESRNRAQQVQNQRGLVMKGQNRSRGNNYFGMQRRNNIQQRWDARATDRNTKYAGYFGKI